MTLYPLPLHVILAVQVLLILNSQRCNEFIWNITGKEGIKQEESDGKTSKASTWYSQFVLHLDHIATYSLL